MTEQLKAQVVEQRAHDNEQHAEMLRLLVEREAKLEAKLEAQRKESDAQRKESEAQRQSYEAKLDAQRKELEAQRQSYETKLDAQRKDLEGKSEAHRLEAQGRTPRHKVTALQLRFEALSDAKLL
eukprot:COSAG06_NODE_23797_length_681_cov_0.982818_1_plen_124_part_10